MKNKLFSALLLSSTVAFTSCATILTGTKDPISFTSTPAGATVYHKGAELCVTPCTAVIPRSLAKQVILVKKEGYDPKDVKLVKKFNPVSLVNILIGGTIGAGIDAATGSLTKYSPKEYLITLEDSK